MILGVDAHWFVGIDFNGRIQDDDHDACGNLDDRLYPVDRLDCQGLRRLGGARSFVLLALLGLVAFPVLSLCVTGMVLARFAELDVMTRWFALTPLALPIPVLLAILGFFIVAIVYESMVLLFARHRSPVLESTDETDEKEY